MLARSSLWTAAGTATALCSWPPAPSRSGLAFPAAIFRTFNICARSGQQSVDREGDSVTVMSELSAEQTRLAQLWEEHMRHEFQTCSTEDTLATMVEDAYVNHVPVMTG